MKKLTEYINNNNGDLMNSSLTKINDTVNHEDVNEENSTEYELEQYVSEYKNNEELNYRLFLLRNYRI